MLGILNASLSTFQPQCTLSVDSQMRYREYELTFVPSPPKFSRSTKSSIDTGTSNGAHFVRSYLASNVQAQHGIDRYPVAPHIVERTGIHGVSSSA